MVCKDIIYSMQPYPARELWLNIAGHGCWNVLNLLNFVFKFNPGGGGESREVKPPFPNPLIAVSALYLLAPASSHFFDSEVLRNVA